MDQPAFSNTGTHLAPTALRAYSSHHSSHNHKGVDLMRVTAMYKLASAFIALLFAGASSAAFAGSGALGSGKSHGNAVYQASEPPPDCDKTPQDPRCKDRK